MAIHDGVRGYHVKNAPQGDADVELNDGIAVCQVLDRQPRRIGLGVTPDIDSLARLSRGMVVVLDIVKGGVFPDPVAYT